jgi:hypothetical protein
MKSSFHSRTLATQLTRCHLFLVIFDCRLKRLPQLFTAGLGLSLYSLGEDPIENIISIVIVHQYFDYCLRIRCRGNLFTASLPKNERLP